MKQRNHLADKLLRLIDEKQDQTYATLIDARGEQTVTWVEFGLACARFSRAYRDMSIGEGGVVLIFLPLSPSMFGAFFGAMLGGYVPSFMPLKSAKQDPRLYWSSHKTLLEKIKPAAVVTEPSTAAEMTQAGLDLSATKVIYPDALPTGGAGDAFAPRHHREICLLQHSSGTTGLKKGVSLAFDSVASQLESYGRVLNFTDADVIASWLPLYHDMGLIACCLLPTFAGASSVHIDPFYWLARPDTLFGSIQRFRASLCWMPNFAFDHLSALCGRRAADFDLSTMKAFINCSETVRQATFTRFAQAFRPSGLRSEHLQCCYAMAETVFAVTQTPLGKTPQTCRADPKTLEPGCRVGEGSRHDLELLESGPVIPGASVSIRDGEDRPVEDGVVGEIVISADFLFSGYNLDPERSAQRLRNGAYRTGDVGFRRSGSLFVLGRTDDMIIVNGRNLYAHEIEAAISNVAGLKAGRNIVISQSDDRVGTDHVVVLAELDNAVARQDKDIVSDVLSIIQATFGIQAKTIKFVEPGWLTKTTSGKISRRAAKDKWELSERKNG